MVSNQKIYQFESVTVKLIVPEQEDLRRKWDEGKLQNFPYWGKCWPAAIALARFITTHPSLIQNKKVLELAAGLGLPSLVAAGFTSQIICSDYLEDPLVFVQQSAHENGIHHLQTAIINWHHLPEDLDADIVLLSDVNYDPEAFDALNRLLHFFLEKKSLIIISTPQRIMAKPFIEKWLPFVMMQEEIMVDDEVWVSVLVVGREG